MQYRIVRSLFVLAAALVIPAALVGQTTFGVKAGLTFSDVSGDEVFDEAETKTGVFAGVGLGIPITEIVGFGTGLYYVQKGFNAPDTEGGGSVDLDYLELPLTLQVSLASEDRPVDFSAFAGPTVGFNLTCDDTLDDSEAEAEDCGRDVTSFDFGLLFGGGVGISAGENMTLSLNGGVDIGLRNVVDANNRGPDSPEEIKNRSFFVGLGLSLMIG